MKQHSDCMHSIAITPSIDPESSLTFLLFLPVENRNRKMNVPPFARTQELMHVSTHGKPSCRTWIVSNDGICHHHHLHPSHTFAACTERRTKGAGGDFLHALNFADNAQWVYKLVCWFHSRQTQCRARHLNRCIANVQSLRCSKTDFFPRIIWRLDLTHSYRRRIAGALRECWWRFDAPMETIAGGMFDHQEGSSYILVIILVFYEHARFT